MEQIIQTPLRSLTPPHEAKRPEIQLPRRLPQKTGRLIPVALTPEQERYAIQALGNRRFVYNLALKTNQFHRHNRMPYPTVNALEKALNACKKEDYPFLLDHLQTCHRRHLPGVPPGPAELVG